MFDLGCVFDVGDVGVIYLDWYVLYIELVVG